MASIGEERFGGGFSGLKTTMRWCGGTGQKWAGLGPGWAGCAGGRERERSGLRPIRARETDFLFVDCFSISVF